MSLISLCVAVSSSEAWAVSQPSQLGLGGAAGRESLPSAAALPQGSAQGMSGNDALREVPALPGLQHRAAASGRHFSIPVCPQDKTGATPRSLGLLDGWSRSLGVPGIAPRSRTPQPPQGVRSAGQLSLVLSHSTSILPTAHLLPRISGFPLVNDPSIFLPTQREWVLSASGAKARSVSEQSQPGPAEASSKLLL